MAPTPKGRPGTDICRYEPLIVEVTFQPFFQPANLIPRGDLSPQGKVCLADVVEPFPLFPVLIPQGGIARRLDIQQ